MAVPKAQKAKAASKPVEKPEVEAPAKTTPEAPTKEQIEATKTVYQVVVVTNDEILLRNKFKPTTDLDQAIADAQSAISHDVMEAFVCRVEAGFRRSFAVEKLI